MAHHLWSLTSDGCYSSKSAYKLITRPGIKQQFPHIPWKLRIPNKVKLFLWLLFRDRLLTNVNLRKRGWPCGDTCVLCSMVGDEDANYLFLHCSYTRRIWNDILLTTVKQLPNLLHRMLQDASTYGRQIAAVCWNIWKERNQRIFHNTRMTTDILFMHVITDTLLWEHI
jgi:zinc-binding in reverse transcriptase